MVVGIAADMAVSDAGPEDMLWSDDEGQSSCCHEAHEEAEVQPSSPGTKRKWGELSPKPSKGKGKAGKSKGQGRKPKAKVMAKGKNSV